MALTKVRTSGSVMHVPVSEFKPAELNPILGDDSEAIIIKNTETLGVYMTTKHRNMLGDEHAAALLLVDMMAAGRSWDDVKRSAEQVAAGKLMRGEDFLKEIRGRK